MDPIDIDSNVLKMHKTIGLMYSLILDAIGYKGSRTDYSTANWPKSVWPPDGASNE